ncbi:MULTISPECIES: heme ABC transporter ATP-binding protein [unclassified Rhizobium]|jgi:iron complex transport system ATP-binding protein|uniref:heme ABC transporter ATP-binding protein n=1 Tax=unclassified Rhizobium TaxID=2613769 RepID=UPI0006473CA8|nr:MULTISPECIES: heme ABC transporter ATP-binding protein [unclassified Rhizobium]MBN8949246.1 heme ABC transporter ATP-binding protein [Rhizobium tropici]OJY75055.1 MAG: heme ABC transporter ATP-binding protein [Rhizobium sp. 60-20]RKD70968.1 iron complex transport system ATP-binding protein [Rhizobium sp. WW_1]
MIDVSNLSVRLAGKPVVQDVSFTAEAGTLTAICGPNGSGKTTTMKAVSGELAYHGTVHMNGAEIGGLQAWQLAEMRGVLPQASSISFPFTVREIVRMGLTSGRNRHPEQADRIATEALAAVDLSGFEGRFYQELSGGEQQRVQLARVLCQISEPVIDGKPCWLLLDEPVSSLDISHQLTIMTLARQFCRRGGGVIAVMHDLNLTALFADRMVLLKNGRLQAKGAVKDVLTDRHLQDVFGCNLRVNRVPADGAPFVLAHSALID